MSSSLRTASNVLVAVLLAGLGVYLTDWVMMGLEQTPLFGCHIIPAWEELTVPLASVVTVVGLALCVVPGVRSLGIWLFLLGMVAAVLPSLLTVVLDPIC